MIRHNRPKSHSSFMVGLYAVISYLALIAPAGTEAAIKDQLKPFACSSSTCRVMMWRWLGYWHLYAQGNGMATRERQLAMARTVVAKMREVADGQSEESGDSLSPTEDYIDPTAPIARGTAMVVTARHYDLTADDGVESEEEEVCMVPMINLNGTSSS